MKSTSEAIYNHALKDLGLKETPGKESTPRIKLAIHLAADWLDPDDSKTAWCGCIRGLWGLETATGVPVAHYRAKNWQEWGEPVLMEDVRRGDTVVLKRSGGYHVALFHAIVNKDRVMLLGGNQSDEVNIQSYRIADIVGIRRLVV